MLLTRAGLGLASSHCPYADSEVRIGIQDVPVFVRAGAAEVALGIAIVITRAGLGDPLTDAAGAAVAVVVVVAAVAQPLRVATAARPSRAWWARMTPVSVAPPGG
ncbi:hypothetical protein Ate02nite_62070 [Paractinoplanes tereljensis]|uniref:Uncharacterized protein n=1 Tax=Paractinoplanes tereljensis TaxID=571912 RepID=A0A919NTG4_9ACTN|nr:hypothetical protein Ate02nite_62070 [Actinoplanes tereljensis]